MKIILSRKGFDSDYGGCASPILPTGELCSLPIPETMDEASSLSYDELEFGNQNLWEIMCNLGSHIKSGKEKAHLDPDLNYETRSRITGWKPLFGQAGAAERHLQNQGVGKGDIFLFYGLFRKVKQVGQKYEYVYGSPELHIIFGWLQIESRISVDDLKLLPEWVSDHPHYKKAKYKPLDSIYVSTDYLELPHIAITKTGAGVFRRFDSALQLTLDGQTKSIWRLPSWFDPQGRKSRLTYHPGDKPWRKEQDYVQLKTKSPGQEFVLNCDDYPEAITWLANLIDIWS